jgi:hypothetical protein
MTLKTSAIPLLQWSAAAAHDCLLYSFAVCHVYSNSTGSNTRDSQVLCYTFCCPPRNLQDDSSIQYKESVPSGRRNVSWSHNPRRLQTRHQHKWWQQHTSENYSAFYSVFHRVTHKNVTSGCKASEWTWCKYFCIHMLPLIGVDGRIILKRILRK